MLGFHISKGKGFLKSIEAAFDLCESLGFSPCGQIFVRGPQGYKECCDDATAIEIGKKYPNRIIIHGAYTDYMNGEPKGIANISAELRTADLMRAVGVVVHLGNSMKLRESLIPAMAGTASTVFLEINATKPPGFAAPEALKEIFDSLPEYSGRLGLCIDTQHLFACGVSLETAAAAAKYLDAVSTQLRGIPIIYHLNDSLVPCGSGRDRHEEITRGEIFRNYSAETARRLGLDPKRHFAESGAAEILRRGKYVILESKTPEESLARLRELY